MKIDIKKTRCLGWVAQFVGVSSYTPKGCGFDSWSGCVWEAVDVSLSPSLLLSLKSINIPLGED